MDTASSELVFDPAKTPFSRYGAYVAVSGDEDGKTLTIHNVRRLFGEDRAFRCSLQKDGKPVDWVASAQPWELCITSQEGTCRLAILADDTLMMISDGLEIVLELVADNGYGTENADGSYEIISVPGRFYSQMRILRGNGILDGPLCPFHGTEPINRRKNLRVLPEDGQAVLVMRIAQVETRLNARDIDYQRQIAEIREEWERFAAALPTPPARYASMALTSWYNLWSCVVRAEDCYTYDAMLMSKKFMCSVWSWDHCFNALAISRQSQQMALQQFLLPFELQADTGALPDYWSPNLEVVWGVTKPPVHGWCFGRLMDEYTFEASTLEKVYGSLEKWTRWWLEYRDSDADGIPDYPQGCDSGWDNSTLFDIGFFLESPDLPAFLVLQMRTLARIAGHLGKQEQAATWAAEAEKLLHRLYEHSWDGRFVSRLSRTHRTQEPQTSLLNLMPLVLGELLDADKFAILAQILQRDFLTAHGLATEMPSSPLYEPDGYWRGPIWAPSTYLLVDGLRRGGRADLAREIARRFCDMIQFVALGNYENFDALSGKGLRAPGYTWTASVFLLLLWEYLSA